MSNHRFAFPFWHHFGSLLAYIFCVFSASILGCLFGCLFSDFWSKMAPKKVRPKSIAEAFGSPRAQRRPKGLPKTNYPPRAFLNRMPDGGLSTPKMPPGPSLVPVLEHFEWISGTICNIVRSRFQVESHPAPPDPTFRGGISKQG